MENQQETPVSEQAVSQHPSVSLADSALEQMRSFSHPSESSSVEPSTVYKPLFMNVPFVAHPIRLNSDGMPAGSSCEAWMLIIKKPIGEHPLLPHSYRRFKGGYYQAGHIVELPPDNRWDATFVPRGPYIMIHHDTLGSFAIAPYQMQAVDGPQIDATIALRSLATYEGSDFNEAISFLDTCECDTPGDFPYAFSEQFKEIVSMWCKRLHKQYPLYNGPMPEPSSRFATVPQPELPDPASQSAPTVAPPPQVGS